LNAGDLDPTFATGGKLLTDFLVSGNDVPTKVIAQPDGKLLVLGGSFGGTGFPSLARYNGDGSLDAAFGSGGKLVGPSGSSSAMALEDDGKIILAEAEYTAAGGSEFAVSRFNSDGSLDTTFGNGGTVLTPVPGASSFQVSGVVLQSTGQIVAV